MVDSYKMAEKLGRSKLEHVTFSQKVWSKSVELCRCKQDYLHNFFFHIGGEDIWVESA